MVLYPILLSQSWSTTVPNFMLVSGIVQSGQNLALSRLANNDEEENKPGLIFFYDFEKAFNSIDLTNVNNCLKHFNFSEDFIKWVKLFYNDAKSCVTSNGYLSDFFSRSARRSLGMSPFHLSLHHMY